MPNVYRLEYFFSLNFLFYYKASFLRLNARTVKTFLFAFKNTYTCIYKSERFLLREISKYFLYRIILQFTVLHLIMMTTLGIQIKGLRELELDPFAVYLLCVHP